MDLDPDELPRGLAEVAKIIGIERLLALCEVFGGSSIYVPQKARILQKIRNKAIKSEFNGRNYGQLAAKYGLSERRIRQIVADLLVIKERKKKKK